MLKVAYYCTQRPLIAFIMGLKKIKLISLVAVLVTVFEMVDETSVNNRPSSGYYTNIAASVSVAGTRFAPTCIKSE